MYGGAPVPLGTTRTGAQPQAVGNPATPYESWFDVNVLSVAAAARTTGTANCAICDAEQPFAATGLHAGGTAFVVYGNGAGGAKHTQLTKPLIVAEGYNLYDIAPDLRECNNPNNNIDKFFRDVSFSNTNPFDLQIQLLNAGYDIVYIDNARGSDDITRNAALFEAVVRWVNIQKVGGRTSGLPNVVMGQSMGGLVARYGLAEMTRRGTDDPHTRLLVLHDSPQRGANNPVGLQSLSRATDAPWLYVPFLGTLRLTRFSPKLRDAITVLDQPATRQLSILSANDGSGGIVGNTFIDGPYRLMIDNVPSPGYTIVAASDGSQCGVGQPTPAHVALSASSSNLFARPVPYLGRISIEANLAAYGLPAYGQTDVVSRARISIRYSLCLGRPPLRVCIPVGRYYLVNQTAGSPANTLPYETLPGGNTNLRTEAGTCADGFDLGAIPGIYAAFLNTTLYNGPVCFVPSYSALDVRTVTPANAFAKYINNATNSPSPPLVTSYVALSAGEGNNLAHLRFTARNSEWMFNEMQRPPGSTAPNPAACQPNPECNPFANYPISGPAVVCAGSGSTYTVAGLPAGFLVTWSLVTAAGAVLTQSNNAATVRRTGAGGGQPGTLQAVISNGCGQFALARTIGTVTARVSASPAYVSLHQPTTLTATRSGVPGILSWDGVFTDSNGTASAVTINPTSGNTARTPPLDEPGTLAVTVTGVDACGQPIVRVVTVVGANGNRAAPTAVLYPNPANNPRPPARRGPDVLGPPFAARST